MTSAGLLASSPLTEPVLATARLVLPIVLATVAVVAIDRASSLRGRQLPGYQPGLATGWRLRRSVGLSVLGITLYLGVFAPLGTLGLEREQELSGVPTFQLFVLHAVLIATLAVYLSLGLSPVARAGSTSGWRQELGLVASSPLREAGVGVAAGVVGWVVVIAMLSAIAAVVMAVGGEAVLPSAPPPMIVLVAGLHWGVRLGLSVSAGVVEEAFFRGLLQPRIGILASSVLFVLAHASYDQPFLLIGVTALSFGFAFLTRWRRTIWPAIVAHTTFDAVQLLVLIPIALEALDGSAAAPSG